jgi:hypothetical protein
MTHGLMRENVFHQQGGAVGHSSCPATGAETAVMRCTA